MGSRGRKSSESLTVIGARGIETIKRPQAPDELTNEQAEEWRAVVDRLPADWFPRETHALLVQYCRHVIASRRIAQLIAVAESGETFDLAEYDRLCNMMQRESRVIASLATKMRLSQQTKFDKEKKRSVKPNKPWR